MGVSGGCSLALAAVSLTALALYHRQNAYNRVEHHYFYREPRYQYLALRVAVLVLYFAGFMNARCWVTTRLARLGKGKAPAA